MQIQQQLKLFIGTQFLKENLFIGKTNTQLREMVKHTRSIENI